MKKRVLSLSLSLLMVFSLLPSTAFATGKETPERGVLTYEEFIAPQYEDAQSFSEDFAAVKKNGKWGFINEENKTVIPFQYAYAWPFSEGKAIVCKEIATLADAPNEKEDGYSRIYSAYSKLEFGFIDKDNKYTPFTYEGTVYNDKTYNYEPTQLSVTRKYYTYTYTSYKYDWDTRSYTDEISYTDTDSNIEIPEGKDEEYYYLADRPEDMQTLIFHNGAAVINSSIYAATGQQIVIHSDDPDDYNYYRVTGALNEGLIPIQYGEEWYWAAYADATGKIVWDAQDMSGASVYSWEDDAREGKRVYYAGGFNQGLAPVRRIADIPSIQTDEDGYSWTRWGTAVEGIGFIDKSFNWVIAPQFNDYIFNGNYNGTQKLFGDTGLAILSNNNDLYGAVDKQGSVVIPFEYSKLFNVSNGLFACEKDGKWGYLDAATLKVAIPLQYDQASSFGGSLAAAVVVQGDKTFLIDRKGEAIPGGDKLDRDTYFKTYADGSWMVRSPDEYVVNNVDGKYGFGKLTYLPPLPAMEEMDSWAYAEVTAAIEEELVPVYLQNLYLRDITRGEFCDLVMQAVTEVLDTDAEDLVKAKAGKELSQFVQAYPFTDTTDSNAIAANALGIVSGRGGGIFDPYATISRQEAAAMLTRAAKVLNMDTTKAQVSTFSDRDSLPSWALEAVDYISQIGVMNGVGNNSFAPLDSYTREQAFMTIYRLFLAQQEGK